MSRGYEALGIDVEKRFGGSESLGQMQPMIQRGNFGPSVKAVFMMGPLLPCLHRQAMQKRRRQEKAEAGQGQGQGPGQGRGQGQAAMSGPSSSSSSSATVPTVLTEALTGARRLVAPILDPRHQVHHNLKRVTAGEPGFLWALNGVAERRLTRDKVLFAHFDSSLPLPLRLTPFSAPRLRA